jgi:hypothetical protein
MATKAGAEASMVMRTAIVAAFVRGCGGFF